MSVLQCEALCQHWQRRGGVVFKAAIVCTALEGEKCSPRLAAIVTSMARTLAAQGRCPAYSPFAVQPDAYLAADLPIDDAGAPPRARPL